MRCHSPGVSSDAVHHLWYLTASAHIVLIPLRVGTGKRWQNSPIPEWHREHQSFTARSWSIKSFGFLEPVRCQALHDWAGAPGAAKALGTISLLLVSQRVSDMFRTVT